MDAGTRFDRVRDGIEAMICRGRSLDEVSAVIEAVPLPREHRDALWLVAWSLEGRPGAFAGDRGIAALA